MMWVYLQITKQNDARFGFYSSLLLPNEAGYCTYYIVLNSSTKSSHTVALEILF